jgi:hypothetical protein
MEVLLNVNSMYSCFIAVKSFANSLRHLVFEQSGSGVWLIGHDPGSLGI